MDSAGSITAVPQIGGNRPRASCRNGRVGTGRILSKDKRQVLSALRTWSLTTQLHRPAMPARSVNPALPYTRWRMTGITLRNDLTRGRRPIMSASSTFLSTSGSGYEAQMGRWSRRLAPLLIDFAGVRSAERVLDVGCGTGSLTLHSLRLPPSGVSTASTSHPPTLSTRRRVAAIRAWSCRSETPVRCRSTMRHSITLYRPW